ncbi:MAG: sigma-54 interaction domain-containing protein [Bradymonadia bacterium]
MTSAASSPEQLELALWRAVGRPLDLEGALAAVLEVLSPGWGATGLSLKGAAGGRTTFVGEEADIGRAPGLLVELPAERGEAPALLTVIGVEPHFATTLSSALRAPVAATLARERWLDEQLRQRDQAHAEADARALRARVPTDELHPYIVGEREGLKRVMTLVDQVAPTDVPVLILGETGSGKEVVARAIHGRSKRANGPFFKVNCGAIPPELVDSELFGHEKGSFTGAIGLRRGWFERADGGTLFLDELGELPAAAQVRLLRVLQDGEFERVGGQRPVHVSLRIVAATHRDMREMLHDGSFREDLWYRLSVFPVRLPPLRERVEDLPALAAYFAERAGQRLYTRPLSVAAEDLDLLKAYAWPGNVRELAAVIDRAAILGYGQRLELAAALGVGGPPAPRSDRPMDSSTLEAANREAIEAALRRTGGRIEGPRGAAAVLGINPHTLRARMRKLGLDWSAFREG